MIDQIINLPRFHTTIKDSQPESKKDLSPTWTDLFLYLFRNLFHRLFGCRETLHQTADRTRPVNCISKEEYNHDEEIFKLAEQILRDKNIKPESIMTDSEE